MKTLRQRIIDVLAAAEVPMTSDQIIDELSKTEAVKRKTLNTVLRRAVDDFAVSRIDGNSILFKLPPAFGESPRLSIFDRCIRQASNQ
ncbi:TPA: hypothetical protein SMF87_004547 [Serratia marcescens]|nr:hypothetical protein [Serratia marcescens]